MKNYSLLFLFLMLTLVVSAQRNIKVKLQLHTGSIDPNIVSSTVMNPAYYFENVSDNVSDSIQIGDTIRFFHPLKGLSGTGAAADTYIVATKTMYKGDVTAFTYTSVRFSDIKSLYDLSLSLKGSPFINNTEYYWYVKFKTISPKVGNIPITSATDMSSIGDTRYKVWINKTTNINELVEEANSNIHIYPNPCVNQLFFSLHGTEKKATVYIVDVSGRNVLVKNIADNVAQQNYSLDVSSLNTGLYFLKFVLEDRVVTRKFNLQK